MQRQRHLILIATVALACASVPTSPRSDGLRPDPMSYVAPSRDFDVIHTRLDLDVDMSGKAIKGSVTHSLAALKPGVRTIRLNCVDLVVDGAEVDRRPVEFEHPVPGEHGTSWIESSSVRPSSDELVVHLSEPCSLGQRIDLEVRYHGFPKVGLYFIGPEKGIPEKRYEVWSQGEGEDNRFWIPCFDYPNDKATYEGIFRVPKGTYALSNGALVERSELGNAVQYHWRLGTPQVSYLIMLAAGEYDVIEEKWNDVPLLYVVPPGTNRETVMRCYGPTVDMMEFFSAYTGIDYPFEKYAQVVVQNFIYGGMENTSATVMNDRTLYDDRASATKNEHGLVAHELAHMWWGDMVTCREWTHIWLNEGFATYFQSLYRKQAEGEDEWRYEYDLRHRQTVALDDKDPRPVVVDFYNRRDARNSSNVYKKGSSVLHMLRFLIGEELFRDVIRTYGERYKFQLVDTNDFAAVVRDVTGENLDWFFEQWIYLAGHPKLDVTQSWESKTGTLRLTVRQTQELGEIVPIFRLPMDLEITCRERTQTHRIVVDNAEQVFNFHLPSRPLMVIVDKGDWTLKTLTFDKPVEDLVYQSRHGDTMARIRAVRTLARKPATTRSVDPLIGILRDDGFWGLRREAALALGKLGSREAQAALLDALAVDEALVRLAVVKALGSLGSLRSLPGNDRIEDALIATLRKDYAYQVRAEALRSLVAIRSDRAAKACVEALEQESHQDVVRVAALRGLVELDASGSIKSVKPLAGPGNRRTYRHEAISAYAKLARRLERDRDREMAADYLAGMLDDWYRKTRLTVIGALDTLGVARVVPELDRVAASDPVASNRRRATKAVARLEATTAELAGREELQAQIEQLTRRIEALRKDLDALQAVIPENTPSGRLSRKETDAP